MIIRLGFIGDDGLWHLGNGGGQSMVINGGIIMGGCGNSYAGGIFVDTDSSCHVILL